MRKKVLSIFVAFALVLSLFGTVVNANTDQDLIPAMTSNTSPSGAASASSQVGSTKAYYAFDGRNNNEADSAWIAEVLPVWLGYEFPNKVVINKYTIQGQLKSNPINTTEANLMKRNPKAWTFEGFDIESNQWEVLDSKTNVTDWVYGEKKEFIFDNVKGYQKYRINISEIQGANSTNGKFYTAIGEMEMFGYPVPSTEGRALLTVYITGGQIKEYDLSAAELSAFLNWYDTKDVGNGPAKYAFTKTWNKGPFKTRTEYVIFDKILTFDVDEYDVTNP